MPPTNTRISRARRAALLACAAATVAALGAGSSPAGAAMGVAKRPKPVVKVSAGDLTVYKVGDNPQPLPDGVRDQVMATLTGYLNAATVKPLQTGTADPAALATALAPTVTARLTGSDRAVLLDEGLPKAVSRIVLDAAPVKLTGLADGDGKIVVVTANLDATTTTKTAKGKVSIKRAGDLVLTPADGTWKISGYTLTVDRLGKGLGAAGTPTPTAPVTPGATTAPAATPGTVAK
jgi:hypothetical protein